MAELESRHITRIKRQVYAQYPEMRGAEPEVAARPGSAGAASATFVLTFKQKISLPGGGTMTRLVRATVNQDGNVIKITSSR